MHCEGSAAGRAAARVTGNINHIWAHNVFSRQHFIQRGARLLSAEPPPKWLVDPNSLHELARSEDHLKAMLLSLSRGSAEGDSATRVGSMVPPWLRAPSWMHSRLTQPWEREEGALLRLAGCAQEKLDRREFGHQIAFVGSLAYCTRCACFAHRRLGSRFKGSFQLPTGRAASAVSSRLVRLRGALLLCCC